MKTPRIAFAGDRDIAVWVLEYLLGEGVEPLALLVSDAARASHADALVARCPFLAPGDILRGAAFRKPEGIERLRSLDLDYVVGVHFPYIVPESVLTVPRLGVLNLHPAFLPFNRGWHTPSWALLEGTPIGATLHFMDAGVDTGDVVHQRELSVTPGDTAHALYARLKQLELEVFKEAWPSLASGTYRRTKQDPTAGTSHKKQDLFTEAVQRIDLDETMRAGDLLRKLRALTTSSVDEAAYFDVGDTRYHVQVAIHAKAREPEAGS